MYNRKIGTMRYEKLQRDWEAIQDDEIERADERSEADLRYSLQCVRQQRHLLNPTLDHSFY